MKNFVKIASVVLVLAMASAFVSVSNAQTTADLQAKIEALVAQINMLQSQLSSQGGSTTGSSSYTYSTNLTVGSKGADVTALQSFLNGKGFLSVAPTGYFGPMTKAALAKYQASAGISPASGFFGPITRANLNSMVAVNPTPTPSTNPTPTPTPTGSTTPTPTPMPTTGTEGILSVTAGPISSSVANVGQTGVPILVVRAQAQDSNINIQRITLDLGNSTTIYNKIYSQLHVVDLSSGSVLASVPLNSSTVVQSGNDYVVSITGFNEVVPMNTYKDLSITADLYSSIDSTYISGTSYTVSIDANGLRGIDGAGIQQYGPASTISQSMTINSSLVDNSQANVSLDANSPQSVSVPVTDTTNGQYLGLPVFAFDVNAQNDTLHLHQVVVNLAITTSSNSGNVSAAYLYQGSTMVQSAAVSNGVATFNNIVDGTAGATIPVNTTVVYTVKVDATGVTTGSMGVTASLDTGTGKTIIYNSQDGTVHATNGSATGNQQVVVNAGPLFTLASTPSITSATVTNTSGTATTTYTATFNLNVQAVGTDVSFGLFSSSTPAFDATSSAVIYMGGVAQATSTNVSTYSLAPSYTSPSNVVVSTDGKSFTVSRGNTVQIPVTYKFLVGNVGSNTYALQLNQIKVTTSAGAQTVNFMAGQTAWRTNAQ